MDSDFLFKGLLIGFSIAAPVGPIGVLCIKRTLAEGRLAGVLSGLGAASADALYGLIAGFGLTMLSDFLVNQQTWLRLTGGAYLLWLGVKTLAAKEEENKGEHGTPPPAANSTGPQNTSKRAGLPGAYFSTLLLTLTNPVTILSFVAVFAGLGLAGSGSPRTAGLLVLGVFCGSAAWWLLLSSGVSLLRGRFDDRAMAWVNRVSGLVLLGFGAAAIAGAV